MFYLMTPSLNEKLQKKGDTHPYNINSSLVPKEQILDPRLLLELNSLNKPTDVHAYLYGMSPNSYDMVLASPI